jgi:hypothetical protein
MRRQKRKSRGRAKSTISGDGGRISLFLCFLPSSYDFGPAVIAHGWSFGPQRLRVRLTIEKRSKR